MKVNINGQIVDAERLTVTNSDEQWSKFTLSDGTVIKLKSVMTGAVRLEQVFNEGGDPVYHLQTPVMFAVEYVPDHLRMEAQAKPKGKPQ